MKYTPELTKRVLELYQNGMTAQEIGCQIDAPERSVIAKLSNLGVYQKKQYLTKRGEVPIKKEEYISKIAVLLGVEEDQLESLTKVNKSILALILLNLQ